MASAVFTDLVSLLVPEERCRTEYLVNYNFFDSSCNKVLVSKCLGLGIVAGSILVKVPQIVKILKSKSVVGLSLLSFLMELMAYVFTMSYNVVQGFPFSTWGEAFFVLVQAVVQVALFFYFAYSGVVAALFVPLFAGLTYALCSGTVPLHIVALLFQATIPLTAGSKIFQIGTNFMNGHTGQLSMITSSMNLLGTLGRIYTTFQEVNDMLILIAFSSATFFNLVIVLQLLFYWNVKPSLKKTQ